MSLTLPKILRKLKVESPTVLLVNDCRDQDNFGAQALIDGLLGILRSQLLTSQIKTIPSHWFHDMSHGKAAFVGGGEGMYQPAAVYPTMADQFDRVADDWMAGRGGPGVAEFLAKLRGADLVVLNGEGSMYRMNLSAQRELFVAYLAKTRLGLPTIFINGLVHLTQVTPILPGMVRKTFRKLDAVAVREPCSLRNLKEYMPGLQVQHFPDSAFFLQPKIAEQSDAVRDLLLQVGKQPFFCFDPGAMPLDHEPPYKSALYELIVELKKIVPQALLVSSAPADDYIAKIATETNSIFVDSLTRYQEFMALTREAQFVVSGRYHNPILAAIMGCPSIALASTSHKVHGTCETIGLIGAPYDGTDLRSSMEAICAQAQHYVDIREALGRELELRCANLREDTQEMGRFVHDALDRATAKQSKG